MLKRPLHKRFSGAVREGRKTTTIRNTPWPVGVPIMLYNWRALPYRSPQSDVAAIVVAKTSPITIEHLPSGQLIYTYDGLREGSALWWTEGFEDGHDIDDWFRPIVKQGKIYAGHLMTFSLAPAVVHPLTPSKAGQGRIESGSVWSIKGDAKASV